MISTLSLQVRAGVTAALIICLAGLAAPLSAQDLQLMFDEVRQTLAQADEANAEILSPRNYAEGTRFYEEAVRDYERGNKIDDIRKKLRGAASHLKKAIAATRLAEVTFVPVLKARQDALSAEADAFAAEKWAKSEEKFLEASRKLEGGDVNDARKKASEAETLYRAVELEAIKATYLNEARDLIAGAHRNDVDDRAPITLARAEELVEMAERELEESRYDRDVARNLAQQAKYEAKHAIYLAGVVRETKDRDESIEALLLRAEEPVRSIAAVLNLLAEFDRGFEPPVAEIIGEIESREDHVADLEQQLQQIPVLQARIIELESRLGDVAEEKTALQQKIEAQEEVRRQFATVEKMFNREEARVLREGEDVILRVVGLNFDVGAATIRPEYFSLLSRVQQAISTFPNATLTIEGHTDSHGGDSQNLALSQQRSDAVREYLLANMSSLKPEDVASIGFGESKPIANNDTREGRRRNRRIDIVIHPESVENP